MGDETRFWLMSRRHVILVLYSTPCFTAMSHILWSFIYWRNVLKRG